MIFTIGACLCPGFRGVEEERGRLRVEECASLVFDPHGFLLPQEGRNITFLSGFADLPHPFSFQMFFTIEACLCPSSRGVEEGGGGGLRMEACAPLVFPPRVIHMASGYHRREEPLPFDLGFLIPCHLKCSSQWGMLWPSFRGGGRRARGTG